MGMDLNFYGFTIVAFGGMGNFLGTILASFLIGMIDSLAPMFVESNYKLMVIFATLILILIFKPSGLLKGKVMKARLFLNKYFLLFILFLAMFFIFRGNDYAIYLLVMIFIYATTALTAILPIGHVGQLVLCQGAFWGLGAYAYALLIRYWGLSPWTCLPMATLFSGLVGLGIAFAVVRTKGIYLAIVTLAFGIIFQLALVNFNRFTGGTSGVNTPHFPHLNLGLFIINGGADYFYYFFCLVAYLGTMAFLEWLLRGKSEFICGVSSKTRQLPSPSESTSVLSSSLLFPHGVCGWFRGKHLCLFPGFYFPDAFRVR